jgi:hypothetical protein
MGSQGQPVLAGLSNSATGVTSISNSTPGSICIYASAHLGGDGFYSVARDRGLYSVGRVGPGVQAYSYQGNGVTSYGRVNGVEGRTANPDASGVYGENQRGGWGSAGRTNSDEKRAGVFGDNTGSGPGVLGVSAAGVGVWGKSPTGRTGVLGEASGSGSGVLGLGGAGIGVYASGERAALRLAPAALPGAPSSGFHEQGELVVDSNGDLHLCKASGTPGTWVLVA